MNIGSSNYGGMQVNLMEVPLNRLFWVCNGGYDAYVVEEDGKRYIVIPNAPMGIGLKHEITESNKNGLNIEYYDKEYIDIRSIKCDCCGKNIQIGYKVYRGKDINNKNKTYCSSGCFTKVFAKVENLTVSIAEECEKELSY